METLSAQFDDALARIEISGDKRERAQRAHTEIRGLLETDDHLCGLGVQTSLIGSYARHTGIYPGKDVDVFVKLTKLDTSVDPPVVFDAVWTVLHHHYGDRATQQNRSINVKFDVDGFSVDAVPAVRYGERWAIPTHDRDVWARASGADRWVETDPEKLTDLTEVRNRAPKVGTRGAYVPTVKLVRQTRRHNLGDRRPGGLYFELLAYQAFESGVAGESFAEIFAATLVSIAQQLTSGQIVRDPVLDRPYEPTPDPGDLQLAATTFTSLAATARRSLGESPCQAAVLWRDILGQRNDAEWVFPIPPGCDEQGREITKISAVTAVGSGEAGGFG